MTGFVPNQTQMAIMRLLYGYLSRQNKRWAIIDQAWMLTKLKAWHGVEISQRSLARNLAALRAAGMIESRRRQGPRPSTYRYTKGLMLFFSPSSDASAIRPGCGGGRSLPAGPTVSSR